MISGILYKPLSFTETVKKYFYRLIIPYFIMNGVCLLIAVSAAIKNGILSLPFLYDRIGAIAIGLGYQYRGLIPVDAPTWFLVALFYVYIMQSFVGHDVKKFSIILSIMSIIIVGFLTILDIDTYTPIDSAIMAYPFFCLGHCVKSIVHKQVKIWYNVLVFVVMLLGTFIVSWMNGRVDMNTCNYGNSIILYYICGTIGSVSVIFLSKLIHYVPVFVKTISTGTILILGFNLMVISRFKDVCRQLFYIDNMGSAEGFCMAIVILIIFYPIILVCSRYFKLIMGK